MDLLAPFRGTMLMPDSIKGTGTTPVMVGEHTVATIVWHHKFFDRSQLGRFEVLNRDGLVLAEGRPDTYIRTYTVVDPSRRPVMTVRADTMWAFTGSSVATRGNGQTLQVRGGFTKRNYQFLVSGAVIGKAIPIGKWGKAWEFTVDIGAYDLSALETIAMTHCLRMIARLQGTND